MKKLNVLLSIPDSAERRKVLIVYAKSLGINTSDFEVDVSKFDEQKLVIQIFDKERSRSSIKYNNMNYAFAGAFLLILGGVFLFNMPKWFSDAYQDEQPAQARGYMDRETGKILTPKDDKEYVVVMNGLYEERDAKGVLRAEYLYDEGELKQKKIYNEKGVLTFVENF